MFHVDSEVGRLRQVILHRPDLELKRLTPDNAADLLFDDVLWVSRGAGRARRVRRGAARPRGRRCTTTASCSRRRWRSARPGSTCWTGSSTRGCTGRWPSTRCAARWTGWTPATLARFLIGGITKREILELGPEPKSIAFHSLDLDGFVLAPLPNLLYQRDTSSWIYGGVSVNAMRRRARMRETDQRRGHVPVAPDVRRRPGSRSGTTARTPPRPPSRAATSWCSATARCWSG